jgi:hypothetical protein
MTLVHTPRIMTNSTTPVTIKNFNSDGHFSTNTFRI